MNDLVHDLATKLKAITPEMITSAGQTAVSPTSVVKAIEEWVAEDPDDLERLKVATYFIVYISNR